MKVALENEILNENIESDVIQEEVQNNMENANENSNEEYVSIEEQLSTELEKKKEEAEKNYQMYLRALAETDNIKKRALREKEEYIKYSSVNIIKKLLPVIDDLNRAMESSKSLQDYESLIKGVEMTFKSLNEILKNEGVEEIECQGKLFDPQYHQPLTVEATDEYPENTVMEELQKGYILNNRVIRPSLVKVSS